MHGFPKNAWRILREFLDMLFGPCNWINGFVISQGESPMATLIAVAPGNSPVYTATPVPAGSTPSSGNVPTWTSSDTTLAPVTANSTGLVATVAISSTATVGANFTLTISYTNPDGTLASGSLSQTIVEPDITSFTIEQTE
jgi:hypothetical protein